MELQKPKQNAKQFLHFTTRTRNTPTKQPKKEHYSLERSLHFVFIQPAP